MPPKKIRSAILPSNFYVIFLHRKAIWFDILLSPPHPHGELRWGKKPNKQAIFVLKLLSSFCHDRKNQISFQIILPTLSGHGWLLTYAKLQVYRKMKHTPQLDFGDLERQLSGVRVASFGNYWSELKGWENQVRRLTMIFYLRNTST